MQESVEEVTQEAESSGVVGTEVPEPLEQATGEQSAVASAAEPVQTVAEVATSPTPDALSWMDFFKPEGIPYAVLMLLVMTALARFVLIDDARVQIGIDRHLFSWHRI